MADLARSILDKWGWAIMLAALSLAVTWGTFHARVAQLEREILALKLRQEMTLTAEAQRDVRLARIDTQLEYIREQIARYLARDRRTDADAAATAGAR